MANSTGLTPLAAWLMTGAFAKTGSSGGIIVSRLVSKAMGLGHFVCRFDADKCLVHSRFPKETLAGASANTGLR